MPAAAKNLVQQRRISKREERHNRDGTILRLIVEFEHESEHYFREHDRNVCAPGTKFVWIWDSNYRDKCSFYDSLLETTPKYTLRAGRIPHTS